MSDGKPKIKIIGNITYIDTGRKLTRQEIYNQLINSYMNYQDSIVNDEERFLNYLINKWG